MLPMPVGDLHAISRELAETGRRVHVLWQEPEQGRKPAENRHFPACQAAISHLFTHR